MEQRYGMRLTEIHGNNKLHANVELVDAVATMYSAGGWIDPKVERTWYTEPYGMDHARTADVIMGKGSVAEPKANVKDYLDGKSFNRLLDAGWTRFELLDRMLALTGFNIDSIHRAIRVFSRVVLQVDVSYLNMDRKIGPPVNEVETAGGEVMGYLALSGAREIQGFLRQVGA